jgi:hypothetical protein
MDEGSPGTLARFRITSTSISRPVASEAMYPDPAPHLVAGSVSVIQVIVVRLDRALAIAARVAAGIVSERLAR